MVIYRTLINAIKFQVFLIVSTFLLTHEWKEQKSGWSLMLWVGNASDTGLLILEYNFFKQTYTATLMTVW